MDHFHGTAHLHPLLRCAQQVDAALDEAAGLDPVYLSTTEKRDVLLAYGAAAARLEALRLRVVACAGDVADLDAARSAGEWQAHQLRLDPAQGRRDQGVATALDQRYAHLGHAMAAGQLQRPQVEVIIRALDTLPADLDPEVRAMAEKRLVTDAAHFGPRDLRRLGTRILETLAPEIAEAHDRARLEDHDARAAATTTITFHRRGDGTTDIHARVADHIAARLKTYLDAYTNPTRRDPHQQPDQPATAPAPNVTPDVGTPESARTPQPTAPEDRRPYPHRLGHAFGRLLEAIDPDRLPLHGGDATTLMINLDYDTLRHHTGHATLNDDTEISPAQTRRLACTSNLIPLVLGADSTILDVGRRQRLFTGALRRAILTRDKTCRTTGCDHPGTWCEAHHKTPWQHGGTTTLNDGILLCPYHHDRTHDPRYDTTHHPDGDITLHLRT